MFTRNPVHFLRMIGLIEGVSFLVLLLVAMPLKYFAGIPMAVKVAGWVHGLLFVVLVIALVETKLEARWSIKRAAGVLVAALLPFGPFVIDRRMKQYAAELEGGARGAAR